MSKALKIMVPAGSTFVVSPPAFNTTDTRGRTMRIQVGSSESFVEAEGGPCSFTITKVGKVRKDGFVLVTLSYDGDIDAQMQTSVRSYPTR